LASTADRVGLSMLATPAARALSAYRGQSAACPLEEFSASPTLQAARENCVTSRSRRRSTASAIEPPNNEPPSTGTICASPTKPTSSEEWVSLNT
jgi:hypothetical protein